MESCVQPENSLLALIALSRRARAASAAELPFLLVNESRTLADYRQAALCIGGKIHALSGLTQPELNAPFTQWLQRVCDHFLAARSNASLAQSNAPLAKPNAPIAATSRDVGPELAAQWGEWLPAFLLWVPIGDSDAALFARATAWDDASIALLAEWSGAWAHAWRAAQPAPSVFARLRATLRKILRADANIDWWKQPRSWLAAAAIAALLFPVRLSVLAPAELVAAHPEVIRAPLDGVIGQFHVEPNQTVVVGQLLFEFDAAALSAQAQVAAQALATAEAEYRQNASLAVADSRSKTQLAALLGKIAEKRAELDYLRSQLERAKVLAPNAGIAVFDDPSEWVGRPVQTGERILRIADPRDVEIEAWLPLGDALIFPAGAPVRMYPSATPLHSLRGELRYIAFEAQARPDGNFAYRVRAVIENGDAIKLGQKGTARIYGTRVPLIYWMLRRPVAAIRQYLGI